MTITAARSDIADVSNVPPHDLAAERIVLGSMMTSTAAADDAIEILSSGADFYHPAHETIYAAVIGLLAAGSPTDPVAVYSALRASNELRRVPSNGVYLHDCVREVPLVANVRHYARIVAELAVRRRVIDSAVRAVQMARNLGSDIADVVNSTQQAIHDATVRRGPASTLVLGEVIDGVVEDILSDRPKRGLSTGIGALDDAIGGLKPGQLVIVAGRPGAGKSILGVDFARATAIRCGIPVLIFSLEMCDDELVKRVLSAEASVNLSRIMHGGLNDMEAARLRSATKRIRNAPLHIDDSPQTDLAFIRATARRMQQRHGLALVLVDYLQLLNAPMRGGDTNRTQQVAEMSRGLKLLAKELQVPVVAAAQLNRGPEQRTDRRPQLSDLRESGSIEADADIVILLSRPDQHEAEHERAGEIDLIIAKNRNGPQETVTCAAQLDVARIVDYGVPER